MIYQAIAKIPDGPVDVKVTGNPTGEYFSRTEQPRGEVIYYVKGNGTKTSSASACARPRSPTSRRLSRCSAGANLPTCP